MLDVIGDLAQALWRGKVFHPESGMRVQDDGSTLDVPTYDFGGLLTPDHAEFIGKERFLDAVQGAQLSPPIGRDINVVLHTGHVIFVCAGPFLYQYLRGEWTTYAKHPARDVMFTAAKTGMWLIEHKQLRFEMAEDSSSRRSINAGRVKGGREPLQPVRIVHLNKVVKIGEAERKPAQGGTHKSPVPHDRAPEGYSRTYKRTGETRWYPGPIKVRGGKEAAGPETFKVVNN